MDAATQVEAARRAVLLVPAPEWGAFVVTGADRVSWLNGLLTCDLLPRKAGDAAYGLAVALKGRIVSDVVVVIDVERVLLLVERAASGALGESLGRYLMMEDAEVLPAADRFAAFFAHGPQAAALLDAARAAGAVGGELDRTGLGGAVIVAEATARERVDAAARLALARLGGVLGDDAGWEALRLERGVPRFGVDFDATTYPQEASLEKVAVSFSKGCYLGQEVVCMIEMRGHVKRKLVPLVMEGDGVPERGARVLDAAGGDVGAVTSAAQSPTLARPVGLAMVKFAVAEVGRELNVGTTKARIVERPA